MHALLLIAAGSIALFSIFKNLALGWSLEHPYRGGAKKTQAGQRSNERTNGLNPTGQHCGSSPIFSTRKLPYTKV